MLRLKDDFKPLLHELICFDFHFIKYCDYLCKQYFSIFCHVIQKRHFLCKYVQFCFLEFSGSYDEDEEGSLRDEEWEMDVDHMARNTCVQQ